MAVKDSGTSLSFATDIVGEFTGATPHSLSEYVRGGAYVPNITANNGIPTTTSLISFSQFYSTTNTSFALDSITPSIYDYEFIGTSTAGIRVSSDGSIYALGNDVPVSSETYAHQSYWITPQSNMSNYYVYATKISGDNLSSGTLNSYLPLSSNQTWQLSNSSDGTTKTTVIALSIWDNGTGSGSALVSPVQYTLVSENDTND